MRLEWPFQTEIHAAMSVFNHVYVRKIAISEYLRIRVIIKRKKNELPGSPVKNSQP